MQEVTEIPICGIEYVVVRATVDEVPDLFGAGELLDGYVCHERCKIFLRAGQPASKEVDTLIHELAHAFIYLSGIGHVLRTFLPPGTDDEKVEEMIVRVATPHLVALIGDLKVIPAYRDVDDRDAAE